MSDEPEVDAVKVVRLRVGYVLAGAPPLRPGTVVALPAPHADRLLSKGRAVPVDRPTPRQRPAEPDDPAADAFLNPDIEVEGNHDRV